MCTPGTGDGPAGTIMSVHNRSTALGASEEQHATFAAYRPSSSASRTRLHCFAASGLSTAQFGEDLVLFGEDTHWDTFSTHSARCVPRLTARTAETKREDLYVVVQNGRLVQ